MVEKSRYWCAVLYPENMIANWEVEIGDILQLPFAYCVHDKDLDKQGEIRKKHIHLIVVFNNTTTKKHAMNVVLGLSASGKVCCSTIENVVDIRHMYEYLIHNTDSCKKKKKFLYRASDRVCGNNFDIGSYEQISVIEKEDMLDLMGDIIIYENFTNFLDFYKYLRSNYERSYCVVARQNSGFLERLTRGNYQKFQFANSFAVLRPQKNMTEDE